MPKMWPNQFLKFANGVNRLLLPSTQKILEKKCSVEDNAIMTEPTITLTDQLRDLKYHQRLDQASLIDRCTGREERVAAATAIVRELAMQRIFDRFTCEHDTELLSRFASLAEMGEGDHPPPFGLGAVSSPRDKQATFF